MPDFSPRGYELPLGSDPIAQGDNAMYANWTLADSEFQTLFDFAGISVRAAIGSISDGVISAQKNYTINYASAGFTSVPYIFFSAFDSQYTFYVTVANTPAPTNTGATVTVIPHGGSTIPRVRWLAVRVGQPLKQTRPAAEPEPQPEPQPQPKRRGRKRAAAAEE